MKYRKNLDNYWFAVIIIIGLMIVLATIFREDFFEYQKRRTFEEAFDKINSINPDSLKSYYSPAQ